MGVQACRLPGLKRLKPLQRCKIFLPRPTPAGNRHPKARHELPQGHINGFSWAFKPAVCQALILLRPTPQAQATPRPHQWLLMGVQACRLPGLKRLKPLQRCKILLLRPIPQAQATPRPHQWLLMGVQACHLPGLNLNPGNHYNATKSSCYAQPSRHKLPQGHINGFLWAFKPAVCQALNP